MKIEKAYSKPHGVYTEENFTQAAPVSTTWYPVLDVVNVSLLTIGFAVRDANEDLEIRMTLSGVVKTGAQAAVANTPYYPYLAPSPHAGAPSVGLNIGGTFYNYLWSPFPVFRDMLIEIRKTSAVGAGDLQVAIAYLQH